MGVAERYLRLALRLGRLDEGAIDVYFGPPEIAREVDAEPAPEPSALVGDADDLLGELEDGWLRDQVAALRVVAGRLAGEHITYADEVGACYGVRPTFTDDAALDTAYAELDGLLPGSGSLRERFRVWEDSAQVPAATIEALMAAVVEEARARTRDLFGLPEGESIEVEFVRDTPWLGYHAYLGDLRGRISINVDRPRSALSLLHLALHESYAGHQAERCSKEASLVRERGLLEETLAVVAAPQSVVSEGLAELAVELMLDGVFGSAFEAIVRAHDIEVDIERDRAVARATEPLTWLGVDAALMLHAEGRPAAEASAYLEDRHMITQDAADRWVRFLSDPASRSYAICYPAGLARCRAFVGDDPARFRTLLTEQVRVSDLTAP